MHPNQYTKSEYDVFTKARNQEIISFYIMNNGNVTVKEICKLYHISDATVRKLISGYFKPVNC